MSGIEDGERDCEELDMLGSLAFPSSLKATKGRPRRARGLGIVHAQHVAAAAVEALHPQKRYRCQRNPIDWLRLNTFRI